jgi:hypothetical protein
MSSETVRRIDQQISANYDTIVQLKTATLSLKTARNAEMLVNRLPRELLVQIFTQRVSDITFIYQSNARELVKSYIAFSHVCTLWRRLALTTPSLWTAIYFLHPVWTHETLVRSALVPLTVHLSSLRGHEADVTTMTKLMGHLGRIQKLSLHISPNALDATLLTMRCSAPLLEFLELDAALGWEGRKRVVLPQKLFAESAPRLRTVAIWRCDFAWDIPVFYNITSLAVTQCNFSGHVGLSIPKAVEALSNMTKLRRLTLRHTFDPEAAITLTNVGHLRFTFPELEEFVIEEGQDIVVTLLECISWPAEAQLKLDFSIEINNASLYRLFDTLREHYCRPNAEPWRSLYVRSDDDDAVHVFAHHKTFPCTGNVDELDDFVFQLKWTSEEITTELDTDEPLSKLLRKLPLDSIAQVSIDSKVFDDFRLWNEVLAGAPINTVALRRRGLEGFVGALNETLPKPFGNSLVDCAPLMPNLRRLVIREFSNRDKVITKAAETLLARMHAGLPRLNEIVLSSLRHFDNDLSNSLLSRVATVIWDHPAKTYYAGDASSDESDADGGETIEDDALETGSDY